MHGTYNPLFVVCLVLADRLQHRLDAVLALGRRSAPAPQLGRAILFIHKVANEREQSEGHGVNGQQLRVEEALRRLFHNNRAAVERHIILVRRRLVHHYRTELDIQLLRLELGEKVKGDLALLPLLQQGRFLEPGRRHVA